MYRGYAAATDAPWDEKSLDFAVKRFSHLLEAYFPGSEHVYMSVIPDKAAFMETPEGYTPAGAQETADYLAQRLPVEIIDIAPLLALEDGGAADGGYTLLHQYTGAGGLHGIRL